MCLSFIVISIPYFSDKPVIRCLIIARCIIVILDVYSIIWKFQKNNYEDEYLYRMALSVVKNTLFQKGPVNTGRKIKKL